MKRNRLVLLVVAVVASVLMAACDDPKVMCDPKCGCASDGQATTWAFCMATK